MYDGENFESTEFGPVNVTKPGDNLSKVELSDYRVVLALERKKIKAGFERVKEKASKSNSPRRLQSSNGGTKICKREIDL